MLKIQMPIIGALFRGDSNCQKKSIKPFMLSVVGCAENHFLLLKIDTQCMSTMIIKQTRFEDWRMARVIT